MSDVPSFTRVRLVIDDVDAGAPVDLDGLHADLRAEDAKVDRLRRQAGGEQLASTSLLLGLYIEAIERSRPTTWSVPVTATSGLWTSR